MPELPEVETVANHLAKLVVGAEIASAELIRERLAPATAPVEFAAMLAGRSIAKIDRRGKHILIGLDDGNTLMVHLRMSGRFILADDEIEEPKFTHARFRLASGKKLLFQDQRHFGFMRIVMKGELSTAKELAKLAPEPFSDEFTPQYLWQTARRSNKTIKEFLLDQTKVCGVGNIYASESMFLATVNPRLRARRITRPKAARLYSAILSVLNETIELGVAMAVDPANIGGSIYGVADPEWRVYGRESEPCPNCASAIRRIVQAGRSTYFCGTCQR